MKPKSILIVAVFVAALLAGLLLGLRWFSASGLAASTVNHTAAPAAEALTKSLEGTILSISPQVPGVWEFDPETYPESNVSFDVEPTTKIITNGSSLEVGVWARVELLSLENGLRAQTIELQPNPPPMTVEGRLIVIEPGVPGLWAIDNFLFTVPTSARVVTEGMPIETGAWARAELVKLPASASAPARREALAVELLRPASQSGPTVELLDHVNEIEEGDGAIQRMRVGDTQVLIDPSTSYDPSLEEDDLVLVRGAWVTDAVLAESVSVQPAGDEVFFEGIVGAVGVGRLSVRTPQDDNREVDISESRIDDSPTVDSPVRVHGLELPDRSIKAIHVWVNPSGSRQHLLGWLMADNETLWTVGVVNRDSLQPVLLLIQPITLIDQSAAAVQPGAWLDITAIYEGADLYRAESVTLLSHPPKIVVQGVVEILPADGLRGEWQVAQRRVVVTDATGIKGTPAVGAFVWLAGIPDTAATLHAELIDVLAQ